MMPDNPTGETRLDRLVYIHPVGGELEVGLVATIVKLPTGDYDISIRHFLGPSDAPHLALAPNQVALSAEVTTVAYSGIMAVFLVWPLAKGQREVVTGSVICEVRHSVRTGVFCGIECDQGRAQLWEISTSMQK
ncbi:hypothetical protein WJX81_001778 [Elliptochloris bilobata]|uniref:Uncharacterized protein n=1 Tax=Elliptochloris bilobata TaxID=381761 RepID=A0AAW1SDN7_9CHLO